MCTYGDATVKKKKKNPAGSDSSFRDHYKCIPGGDQVAPKQANKNTGALIMEWPREADHDTMPEPNVSGIRREQQSSDPFTFIGSQ